VARSDAQLIRVYAKRAKKMLGFALAGKPESQNNWLPPPETPEDTARYKELQDSADAIVALIDDGKPLPFDLVLEYGFIHHINAGWGWQGEQPLSKRQKNWQTKRDESNAKRHANADSDVLAELATWRRSHHMFAKDAVDQFPCGRRKRDRLLALLKAGRIQN
jgi:hypothetical protein